jgi:hypothetical protein
VKKAAGLLLLALCASRCGKKGDPLPPLVRLPVAPPAIKAERRGSTVDVTLTVPATNTDGTRPANIQRVELFALNSTSDAAASTIIRYGSLVGSVEVKKPRDPNQSVDVNDPDADVEPPEGPGLDQGTTATLHDSLGPANATRRTGPSGPVDERGLAVTPLAGAPARVPSRFYTSVGVSSRGRLGPPSPVVAVPLIAPPPAPQQPHITYNESAVTIGWDHNAAAVDAQDTGVLPSRSLVETPIAVAYNVYELPSSSLSAGAPKETRLTSPAVAGDHYDDRSITWGIERCYVVRTVETVGSLSVEGDPSPPACMTPVDTFPPAAPAGLQAIARPGAISLLWDANSEPDLAGYLVLRGKGADEPMTVITPAPIQTTSYSDAVAADVTVAYAVKAVDKAGNISPMSPIVVERGR